MTPFHTKHVQFLYNARRISFKASFSFLCCKSYRIPVYALSSRYLTFLFVYREKIEPSTTLVDKIYHVDYIAKVYA